MSDPEQVMRKAAEGTRINVVIDSVSWSKKIALNGELPLVFVVFRINLESELLKHVHLGSLLTFRLWLD